MIISAEWKDFFLSSMFLFGVYLSYDIEVESSCMIAVEKSVYISQEMWDWYLVFKNGTTFLRIGSMMLKDSSGEEVVQLLLDEDLLLIEYTSDLFVCETTVFLLFMVKKIL